MIFVAIIYICIGGMLANWFSGDLLEDKNPLWRLVILLFWPIVLVTLVVAGLIMIVRDFCKEVIDWYRRKK